MWKDVIEPDRSQMAIRRMRIACWIPKATNTHSWYVELLRNLVAHGDAREGKWRGNWRMELVASTLTPPPNVVYPALIKLMRTPRLPAVDWTDAPTDMNGLVRFGERRSLVSARVPSRSARAIILTAFPLQQCFTTHAWMLHYRYMSCSCCHGQCLLDDRCSRLWKKPPASLFEHQRSRKHTKERGAMYWMGIGCEILPSPLIVLWLVIGNGQKLY